MPTRTRLRPAAGPVAADAVAVLVFVTIGRHAHHHGLTIGGVASTAWPFLAGALVGWLAAVRTRRRGLDDLAAGVVVWLATVALGMVLRVMAGQGTAVAFVVVALAFLALFLLGWRLVLLLVRTKRP